MLTYPEALQRLLDAAIPVTEHRSLPLVAANQRILAAPQYATVSVPPLDNSAMDGYALRAADIPLPDSRLPLPVSQRIPAGSMGHALEPGTVARIFTGAPIPPGADTVVMQEHCEQQEKGVIILKPPKQGDNIRRAGEDMAQGQEILPAGILLRPQELSLAASGGLAELPVYRRLRVAIFSTGDELHQPGEPLPPGGIYNSNRFAMYALLESMGCEVRDLGLVADNLESTRAALREAAVENDLILTSGGVSVGEEDHVKPAVEQEGQLDMWKVAIKPGKPLAFGTIGKGEQRTFFVGLPGNPVSSFITFLTLVRPFIQKLQGRQVNLPIPYQVPAAFAWSRDTPLHEFLRARRNAQGQLELFSNQGSGVTSSLVWGEGLVMKLPHANIAPGDLVPFLPFSELLP
ncbi:MAG: molybdopterin molybdotransferase MoeA [Azovibrio sp.]